jgi:hypothetical protein
MIKEVSDMGNLLKNLVNNPITTEIEEKEWGLSKNRESKLKDQKHLEMAYEWLKRDRNGSQLYSSNHFREGAFFEPRELVIRNWQHLEMTYEWLRSRGKITPLIRKRRIWWEPVPEASFYVVYVSQDRSIFNPENFSWEASCGIISKVVNGKTELILPDEWPEFPKELGTYYIGITSRDDLRNESDPRILEGLFKFVPPPPPLNGGIEYL